MDREDTKTVLKTIVAVYPQFLQGRDAEVTLNIWATLFADEPASTVQAALLSFISTDTKGFAPSPGQVKEQIAAMRERNVMGEGQAWSLVRRALNNGIYGYKEQFAKLPPAVQAAVGQAEMLREWAKMDEEEVNSVVASNFQRAYRARTKSDREYSKLPQSVRQALPSNGFTAIGDIVNADVLRLR